MTADLSDKEHAELIALYNDANKNIEFFKKRLSEIPLHFCAFIAALIVASENFKSFFMYYQVESMVLAVIFCFVALWLICVAEESAQKHRLRLDRVFEKFSQAFQGCRNDKPPSFRDKGDNAAAFVASIVCVTALGYYLFLISWPGYPL